MFLFQMCLFHPYLQILLFYSLIFHLQINRLQVILIFIIFKQKMVIFLHSNNKIQFLDVYFLLIFIYTIMLLIINVYPLFYIFQNLYDKNEQLNIHFLLQMVKILLQRFLYIHQNLYFQVTLLLIILFIFILSFFLTFLLNLHHHNHLLLLLIIIFLLFFFLLLIILLIILSFYLLMLFP